MWKRISERLSKLKELTPNHLYASIFAVIAVGTAGTQTGILWLPVFKGPPPPYTGPSPSPSLEFRAFTSEALLHRYTERGYTLDGIRSGQADVPRMYLTELPHDLSKVTSAKERKELFLASLLPLILRVNERLVADRARLQVLNEARNSKKATSRSDSQWLTEMQEIYAVENGNIRLLIARVDAIPVSLALAQAATESGWGTSRFAKLGNALFGQWTENRNVRGMAPAGRDANKKHRVRAFKSLMRSVWKYALNLNNHPAYQAFREARAAARRAGAALSGDSLTHTLTEYSERGTVYTEELSAIIRINRLNELDDAKLMRPVPTS
ncbi:MAG: hypothetical protein CL569_04410 [Alphaproteobacteria bacterium]|nr:hypothetical protein [Alphaproteobacteria bacterium]|tara:strand:+ start:12694 stop:13668 length:975 start_codon:yes stop_codon:yes gene_type:complete